LSTTVTLRSRKRRAAKALKPRNRPRAVPHPLEVEVKVWLGWPAAVLVITAWVRVTRTEIVYSTFVTKSNEPTGKSVSLPSELMKCGRIWLLTAVFTASLSIVIRAPVP
jgi:hypothetical protein